MSTKTTSSSVGFLLTTLAMVMLISVQETSSLAEMRSHTANDIPSNHLRHQHHHQTPQNRHDMNRPWTTRPPPPAHLGRHHHAQHIPGTPMKVSLPMADVAHNHHHHQHQAQDRRHDLPSFSSPLVASHNSTTATTDWKTSHYGHKNGRVVAGGHPKKSTVDDEIETRNWRTKKKESQLSQQQIEEDLSDLEDYYDYGEESDGADGRKLDEDDDSDDSDDNQDYQDDEPHIDSIEQHLEAKVYKTRSITDEKKATLGDADAVEKTFNRHQQNTAKKYYSPAENKKAKDHQQRMSEEGRCKTPRPKIIPVNDPSKSYSPHCTVLHRCADDTGCCDSDGRTCVAKTTATVHLYFYMFPTVNSLPDIVVLPFINHTECHCVNRSSIFKRNANLEGLNGDNRLMATDESYSDTTKKCQCPSYYTNIQSDTKCHCDCARNNEGCRNLKYGMEGFSIHDRGCISNGNCSPPTCKFGKFSIDTGRCPAGKRHIKRTISKNNYG